MSGKYAFILAGLLSAVSADVCWAQAREPAASDDAIVANMRQRLAQARAKLVELNQALSNGGLPSDQLFQQAHEARNFLQWAQTLNGQEPSVPPPDRPAPGAVAEGAARPERNDAAQNNNGNGGRNANANNGNAAAANGGGQREFGGIQFGAGIAFGYDLGSSRRVQDAQVVNGIVRVTRRNDVSGRAILESHYFFTPCRRLFYGLANNDCRAETRAMRWGWGPFLAVLPGSDTLITAIGGGLMMGFRRNQSDNSSFNVGLGVLYDLDVQVLGDGIVENQPLPNGETVIRYQRDAQSAFMIMTSFTF